MYVLLGINLGGGGGQSITLTVKHMPRLLINNTRDALLTSKKSAASSGSTLAAWKLELH